MKQQDQYSDPYMVIGVALLWQSVAIQPPEHRMTAPGTSAGSRSLAIPSDLSATIILAGTHVRPLPKVGPLHPHCEGSVAPKADESAEEEGAFDRTEEG